MEKHLHIEQLFELERVASAFSRHDSDYVYAHISPLVNGERPSFPMRSLRFEGLTFLLCHSGKMVIDVNLNRHVLSKNMIMFIPPMSIVNIEDCEDAEIDVQLLALNHDFMHTIPIDLNTWAASNTQFKSPERLSIQLTDGEFNILNKIMELMHSNTVENHEDIYIRSIARNLMSALFYQILEFSHRREEDTENERPATRRLSYVNQFMALVKNHFREERSVGFYADKLFISPKYLSLIIKEVTGKSATAWIDQCVILEAKNLLKFSGKNVQQIAYELNFTNQSSFGKYFKHLTGMSPTQYQQS